MDKFCNYFYWFSSNVEIFALPYTSPNMVQNLLTKLVLGAYTVIISQLIMFSYSYKEWYTLQS